MNTLLTALRDQIAENLYPEQITSFIEEFDAACVGKNTSDVWRQFAIWMLVDPEHGVIKFTKPGTDAHDVIQRVAQLYVDNCKDIDLWREAARCARSALYAHADQGANYNTTTYNATTAAEYATYAAYEYDYFADKYAASAAEEAASAYYSAWSNNWTKYDYENDDEDEYEIMADLANNETANDDAFYETMADKLLELIKQAPEKT